MKTPTFFLAILLSACLQAQPGNSESLAAENLKPFTETYGIITYDIIEGGEGTGEMKFDKNGLLTATSLAFNYTMYGMQASMNELTIRDGDYLFIYDLSKKTGRQKKMKTETDLLRYKTPEETRDAMYAVNGGEKLGKETILGKEANHWKFTSGSIMELWEWNGITLKAKIKKPRVTFTYEATAVNFEKPEIAYPSDISIN